MSLALYRKYRPKKLADVVGQDHIITTLQNALKTKAISHAYLLTGPKGVGKTSIARILAHEINGLPYSDDSLHLDIIEIDAASNRRIDEIRDLRDKIHITPTSAKYKVYIIDEVHMLTREAFNALLKTLEEPPEHVVFILATTEAHKVPETIASRTQRFTFKPIQPDDVVKHLAHLAQKEAIKIDSDALEVLAMHGNGSFRDSINLLDQLSGSDTTISKAGAESILGIPSAKSITNIETALKNSDSKELAAILQHSRVDGINSTTLAKELAAHIRQDFIDGTIEPQKKVLILLGALARITGTEDPFTHLELALFSYITDDTASRGVQLESTRIATKVVPAQQVFTKPNEPVLGNVKIERIVIPFERTVKQPKVTLPKPVEAVTNAEPSDYWKTLITIIKGQHNTMYSMLRMAVPQLDGDVLTLTFSFSFHQKQMSTATNQQRIANTASSLLGRSIEVKSVFSKPGINQSPTNANSQSKTKTTLSSVSNIFEGAELLE